MIEPQHYTEYALREVEDEGADGASIRWVIDERPHGAPTYRLRVIEVEPGGHTPHHDHWFEHENYVISGEGEVQIGEKVFEVKAGDVVFVPPHVEHQYRSTGDEPLKFLCGIPSEWVQQARPELYEQLPPRAPDAP